MSDLYTSLQFSPKKKKCPPDFDNNTLTPKKLRIAPLTPPPTKTRITEKSRQPLPPSLSRLYNLHNALQLALSHALATCAISPTSDSGIVRNVLNHISVVTYTGFSTNFEIDDLKRLCWLWEWDSKSLPTSKSKQEVDDDDNPFLSPPSPTQPLPTDWTRGSMGFIITSATHYSKADRKRVPAYGIGIEVEIDIDKDMGSGMAAVARWTAMADKRRSDFLAKLHCWVELHDEDSSLPSIPVADIPELSSPKISALTRTLASCSPSAISSSLLPGPPPSPSRSPSKKSTRNISAIPFPTLASKSPIKNGTLLFPKTPSRREHNGSGPPETPSTAGPSSDAEFTPPVTPVHQRQSDGTPVRTPSSSSRRQALLERVRQRSLSSSPTKLPQRVSAAQSDTPKMTRDQFLKLGQDAIRRRCLLGRLGGVAESVWMLFSNPTAGGSSTPSRKRRALPMADVITAVVKSSPVPISTAEANESITMLIKLCPFFVKKLDVLDGEWLEMPAPAVTGNASTVSSNSPKKGQAFIEPASPGRLRGKDDSAQELLHRSPRWVKREGGGLREVREIIRRELELDD